MREAALSPSVDGIGCLGVLQETALAPKVPIDRGESGIFRCLSGTRIVMLSAPLIYRQVISEPIVGSSTTSTFTSTITSSAHETVVRRQLVTGSGCQDRIVLRQTLQLPPCISWVLPLVPTVRTFACASSTSMSGGKFQQYDSSGNER
jgi:hypothetical protein